MTEHTLRCGDLKLFAQQDLTGWRWMIDGPGEKNVAIAANETSAKSACINVAKARLRRAGVPIPDSLNQPRWKAA
jgi:hypothetical protein